MRRTARPARMLAITVANAVFWTAAWLAWPARDSLPRLADLSCGGAFDMPDPVAVRAARAAMVEATGGDPDLVGPYLAGLAETRAGGDARFGTLVAAVHQTALDHGLGLYAAPRRSRLLPDVALAGGVPEYVLRYRAGTKWVVGWRANHEISIRLAVATRVGGGRTLAVLGDQRWRRPFSREARLPRGSVACPPLPDAWDDGRVEAQVGRGFRDAAPPPGEGTARFVLPASAGADKATGADAAEGSETL